MLVLLRRAYRKINQNRQNNAKDWLDGVPNEDDSQFPRYAQHEQTYEEIGSCYYEHLNDDCQGEGEGKQDANRSFVHYISLEDIYKANEYIKMINQDAPDGSPPEGGDNNDDDGSEYNKCSVTVQSQIESGVHSKTNTSLACSSAEQYDALLPCAMLQHTNCGVSSGNNQNTKLCSQHHQKPSTTD